MKYKILIFLLLQAHSFVGFAQYYETDLLTKEFHKGRRESLRKNLPDKTCAVFFSGAERQRANDTKFIYHQDPDFYYLTGLLEPNAMIIIFKDEQRFYDTIITKELIFVQDRDPAKEMWTGKILGTTGAVSYTHLRAHET
jgi:Xaa-Pro aminopeptidase